MQQRVKHAKEQGARNQNSKRNGGSAAARYTGHRTDGLCDGTSEQQMAFTLAATSTSATRKGQTRSSGQPHSHSHANGSNSQQQVRGFQIPTTHSHTLTHMRHRTHFYISDTPLGVSMSSTAMPAPLAMSCPVAGFAVTTAHDSGAAGDSNMSSDEREPCEYAAPSTGDAAGATEGFIGVVMAVANNGAGSATTSCSGYFTAYCCQMCSNTGWIMVTP